MAISAYATRDMATTRCAARRGSSLHPTLESGRVQMRQQRHCGMTEPLNWDAATVCRNWGRIHRRVLACIRHSPAPFLEAGACAAVWDVAALLRAARVVQLRHGHASSCVPRAGQNFQRPRVCSVPAVPRCCFGMLQPGCGVWRRGTKSGLHRDCPEWRENGWGAQEWTWDGRTLKNSPKGPRKWTGETVQNI